ncbi:hypothetical protein [Mycobacterium intracellulare]|uniref:Uncharacterized protein n=1 Tax=Mycobacterium intracellulare subsp. chimaera TaxID=222805 RepID=A0A7U5MML5_MYCIT|nr:hypothetical protein [Mycobacterium intracellulare]ASL16259.1 hypothetical protein MYCOZU2_03885 [Mycobacterium intracellulare subsp. chimaera]ASQ87345.1 hypothetical protein CE197_18465 [Mycobacterium intracellulare subsp. chimaera]MCF1814171.1 hypothetical protein [Mycobacterium intracellulare subsp. intracellulare]MDM3928991.1 hypothetical protein [Mycobacterium intracellulare subsp. chimaera]MDS0335975.1 hypothetical protein [Mycobacterium intracellulare]
MSRKQLPRPIVQGSRVSAADGDPSGVGTVITPVSKRGEVSVHWDIDGPGGKPQRRPVAELVALNGDALARDRQAARKRIARLLPIKSVKAPPRAREVRGGLPGHGKRS